LISPGYAGTADAESDVNAMTDDIITVLKWYID
jgi:hypothetical protein